MSKINRGREGFVIECIYEGKMRAWMVNEERNEIGWEGAITQTESWGERERWRWKAGESPDEGVEMMGWQFPSTRLFFRAVKHIVRHCLKCPA